MSLDYGEFSDSTEGSNVLRSSDDWVAILQGVINGFDITAMRLLIIALQLIVIMRFVLST